MFTENKKKRVEKLERKPAWEDKTLEKLSVSIEDKSRLRKLKQTESETHISGNYPLLLASLARFSKVSQENGFLS